jgi:CheY-like chemotaxis protein
VNERVSADKATSDKARPWSGETLSMDSGAALRIAIARYRLRAAAHRIAADCERMLDDMDRPERRLWRDAVGEALVASRHLVALLARQPAHGGVPDAGEYFAALFDQIREPQQQIIGSMNTLLGFVPTAPEEELLLQDAKTIRETAVDLWALEDTIAPAAPAASAPAGPGVTSGETGLRRQRLLVVDDDPAQRQALSRLLERLGYEVAVAEDGRAALEIAEGRALDLVVTDIAMPELDGFELLRRLKSAERTRHIPVIMVSGVDDLQSVVRCIEQGAEDHITKPYEPVLLQARIRASLERKRMRDLELAYLRRVGQLTAAAEAVEHQAYQPGSLDALGLRDDELGRLARVFDRMVYGMRSREVRLQRRLDHLRHETQQARSRGSGAVGPVSGESPFESGQVIADRYEILGELGKGGMGMVYHARDRQLGEEIAMKVVRRDLVGQDMNLVERLKSEIRLARRISHRNVVRLHDLGEWHGVYFLTMEYVKGISVAELLNTQGALTVESTLAIGTQLAEALAVAHDQQIIHRDIKPENLLIDEQGILKVMDFGLARLPERGARLTQAGNAVGTPGYMAPEAHLGAAVDARSDLFSAGVVLYECLSGRAPFDASSPMEVIDLVLTGRPKPLRGLVPQAPQALVSVIERLLQREPRDRPGSARELAEQLAEIGQTHR